jgi:hypothetical protein
LWTLTTPVWPVRLDLPILDANNTNMCMITKQKQDARPQQFLILSKIYNATGYISCTCRDKDLLIRACTLAIMYLIAHKNRMPVYQWLLIT